MGKQQHGRSKYETNKNNNDEDNSSEDSQLEPKTSLAVPAMSIAGIAALNSGLNTFMSTKGTSSIASAGVLTAAAVAAGEGLKYYNDRLLTKKAFDQTKTIYNREKIQAKELHNDALQNERRLHYQELEREAEQHLQDMTNQLRESQKEADRDLWEQQNTEKQNSMTVAALFLAGAFALAVEGQLPPNTGGLYFFPSISLLNAYYFCLAACIALLFISILSGMVVVKRMARFMLSRTAKQQETLKQLRELANKQLRELQGSESRYFSDSTSSLKGLSEMNNNNNNEGNSSGTPCKNGSELHERLQKARHQFSEHLWEQPVMVMGWRPIGSGRHVASFQEWYFYDKAYSIAYLNSFSFRVGAILLIFSLGIYEEGILLWGGEEGEPSKLTAALIFWIVLLSIAASLFLYLEIIEVVFPTPHWRETIARTVSNRNKRDLFEDSIRDISFRQSNLRQSNTSTLNRSSSELKYLYGEDNSPLARLLRPFRYESTLETVNVEVIKVQGRELFQAMDIQKDGRLHVDEICCALGFNLPLIPGTSNILDLFDERGDDEQGNMSTPSDWEGSTNEEQELKAYSANQARGILREHSILQEAVVKLLVRKVRSHIQFINLRHKDPQGAENYIRQVKRNVSIALHAIEEGTEPSMKNTMFQNYCCHKRKGKQPLGLIISKDEWDQIMTGIFHDKFF
eukprot:CAMPEP_0194221324 /NCGR_PEP_ID=MMETSP0156-20130528/30367_1 /TAXON_ID=33649 /ORGANISM="Thalassionema nitzschioides, Strain L26-B" /LENGTH=684 /DNA_ID=CAMNT_0038951691 /DNA_START=110 /DNA_END=2164 /DNA_ORIENTATION=-